MIEVGFDFNYGFFDGLDERVQLAILKKMTQLTNLLYDKVLENLSGKVLQTKSGTLAASLTQTIDDDGVVVSGNVSVPGSPKNYALEFGGKSFYTILPVKARVLRFIGRDGDTVFASEVFHPPSKEFMFLRLAAAEVEAMVPEELRSAIQAVFDGE